MMGLWVALGGILGAWSRYALGQWATVRWGQSFPVGTAVINGTGAFLLGLSVGAGWGSLPFLRGFWEVGFLGSYTTFSTFGYELVQLLEGRQFGKAAAYLGGSGVLGVLLAGLGYGLGQLVRGG